MSKEKRTLDIKNIILNILLVVLSLVLFICICIMCSRINTSPKIYKNEVRYLTSCISRKDYANLVNEWEENLKYGITAETNPEYTQVYAVAEYYNLLPMYIVYKEKGYTEKAAECEARLEKDREDMGELAALADEFDATYGLK